LEVANTGITNDDWHEKNLTMSKKLWGMRWKHHMTSFVWAMFDLKHKDPKQGDLK
jgi:hypothetical protein